MNNIQNSNSELSADNGTKPTVVGNPSLSQREIKFRLYDKLKKEIVFDDFHVFGEVTLFNAIGAYAYETKGEKSSLERYNDFEIMQYTGLKDKNGKDIYEGDVLKYINPYSSDDNDLFFVSFFEGAFVSDDNKEKLSEVNEVSEIVGNVFENPELLESVQ